jgi:phosphate butyryltransferase
MITSFEELVKSAQSGAIRRVVLAGCDNAAAIHALKRAEYAGIAIPVLVGSEQDVRRAHDLLASDSGALQVVSGESDADIAAAAVQQIREGSGDILLKGSIPTSALMHAVLDKESGIRGDDLLSDSFLFEHDGRLVNITDGGVILYPDVYQKQSIIENAVRLYHGLGVNEPKVAICAAIEKANHKMPPSLHAADLREKYESGEITGCVVDGPLALDGALSAESLQIKKRESALNGKADILVMPDIEAANITAKSVQYIAGKEAAHVIMGAEVPVLIPSRSDSAEGKYLSIALAAVVSASQNINPA